MWGYTVFWKLRLEDYKSEISCATRKDCKKYLMVELHSIIEVCPNVFVVCVCLSRIKDFEFAKQVTQKRILPMDVL